MKTNISVFVAATLFACATCPQSARSQGTEYGYMSYSDYLKYDYFNNASLEADVGLGVNAISLATLANGQSAFGGISDPYLTSLALSVGGGNASFSSYVIYGGNGSTGSSMSVQALYPQQIYGMLLLIQAPSTGADDIVNDIYLGSSYIPLSLDTSSQPFSALFYAFDSPVDSLDLNMILNTPNGVSSSGVSVLLFDHVTPMNVPEPGPLATSGVFGLVALAATAARRISR